ncbi:nuclear transport factor 2 family protein [Brevundimonas sp. Root1279]|uniref:nuclear transport factor 2 family protein n=1 Tax=Brevundimonas sp. Root1279 TaxID=1736443 RepID=UPI0006F6FEA6|nr:nuclear transport factor 2 family protein [Brevundimonas sp. Root1279]KQW80823.1 hypothetical protein ASC65_12690 [Brevundimonas sp. Root1279]
MASLSDATGVEAMHDLIETAFRAIEMGDHDVLETCLHPDVTYRRPGVKVLSGRDEVMNWYRRERVALTSRILMDEVVAEGDRAVVLGMVEGRGRDGAPIHERFADAYAFEDGLIRDRTTYFFRHGF